MPKVTITATVPDDSPLVDEETGRLSDDSVKLLEDDLARHGITVDKVK